MHTMFPACPACGDPIDYCQGHGEMGDPYGWAVLRAHDNGHHADCDPRGCEYVTTARDGSSVLRMANRGDR